MVRSNLWESFMSEARNKVTTKLPSNKSLIILGANGSGKTTVAAKLRHAEIHNNGYGLEYTYLNICDEYFDEQGKLDIWILDGEPSFSNLLNKVLHEQTYPDTTIMLVVSMSTPWHILQQLEHWVNILNTRVKNLSYTEEKLKTFKTRNIQRWKSYVPFNNEDQVDELTQGVKNMNLHKKDESMLINNLGLDIIVVVSKTDFMSKLEATHGYTHEHFDYLQQRIRRFCLQNGLSLIYTSIKNDKNFELLRKYLLHKIYNFPLGESAILSEHDSIFIPAGYDNMRNISILFDNLITLNPDDKYETIISVPIQHHKSSEFEQEIVAEDEQIFLQNQLHKFQWTSKNVEAAQMDLEQNLNSPDFRKLFEKRLSYSTPTKIGSPSRTPTKRKVDSPTVENGNSSELASFFNTLLFKKVFRSTNSTNASITETELCTSESCTNNSTILSTTEEILKDEIKNASFNGRALPGSDTTPN